MDRITAFTIPAIMLAVASLADAQEAVSILPDLSKTPGKIDPAVTVEQLRRGKQEPRYKSRATTECAWGRYGILKADRKRYRLDHSIPLELGGVSNSCDNLWPQPVAESYRKDCLEDVMADLVRRNDGSLPLAQAQREMAANWSAAFAKYGLSLCARATRKRHNNLS